MAKRITQAMIREIEDRKRQQVLKECEVLVKKRMNSFKGTAQGIARNAEVYVKDVEKLFKERNALSARIATIDKLVDEKKFKANKYIRQEIEFVGIENLWHIKPSWGPQWNGDKSKFGVKVSHGYVASAATCYYAQNLRQKFADMMFEFKLSLEADGDVRKAVKKLMATKLL